MKTGVEGKEQTGKPVRLASLDALRGFDMFFIMGGEALVCTIAALLGYPEFHKSFDHVPWHGLQFMDTVFPLFLFMAGTSFPFSLASSRAKGLSDRSIAIRSLKRGLILFALGMMYDGFFKLDFEHFRVFSVLGRIGLAWMFASWIYLYVRCEKVRLGIAAGILVLVTAVTLLVPAFDAPPGADVFSAKGNIGCWLDRTLIGEHCYSWTRKTHDPEGFAGLIPAIVTAMLGMFAGDIVRRNGAAATGRKALSLLACSAACGVLAFGWSFVFPINKQLWSPSFVLALGCYSFAMFALFYWIVDVLGFRKWAFFFTVIGLNSITIYLAQAWLGLGKLGNVFFGGLASKFDGDWAKLISHLGYIAACWVFLLFLHRKKIYLKV